ncbi:MAG: 16S rRNA (cytosine(1402)-N(4))-methyltransferase RsmH [Chromatiales bacterium]
MADVLAHQTVLLQEAVEALNIQVGGCYIDGTFGRGGHSAAILERLGENGCLIAIDKDEEAVAAAAQRFAGDARFHIEQASFAQLRQVAEKYQKAGEVNGLLLDLGVSSPQLDDPLRGFSFQQDGPLDMRMDRTQGISASDWLNTADEGDIAEVLKVYGEERFARRIARAVVAQRDSQPLVTTRQFAELIAAAVPRREKGKNPATRSFQAVRIKVNRELDDLVDALDQSLQVLAQGARLVVISFHSLEDRIVKRFMRKQSQGDRLPNGLPVQFEQSNAVLKTVGKAVHPSEQEIKDNVRARSAVMRVAEVL